MRREIVAFGSYYKDFMATLHDKERRKVLYALSLLEREDRLPIKFIKHLLRGLYELRILNTRAISTVSFLFSTTIELLYCSMVSKRKLRKRQEQK